MEVHAHSHTPRKKWTHYFWEFIMLFLAVFCGFLAEYKLEHMIEHQREKEYMESLAEDVKLDIQTFSIAIERIKTQVLGKDSLLLLIEDGTIPSAKASRFYDLHWKYVGYTPNITSSKRTMNQLLNAGGLRLIQKKKVSDAISVYSTLVYHLENARQTELQQAIFKALDASVKLVDARYTRALPDTSSTLIVIENPVMRNASVNDVKDFAFMLEMDKENNMGFLRLLYRLRNLARELLVLIEDNY